MKLIVQTADYGMFTVVKASSPDVLEGYEALSLLTVPHYETIAP
jgi:hypothetical protein